MFLKHSQYNNLSSWNNKNIISLFSMQWNMGFCNHFCLSVCVSVNIVILVQTTSYIILLASTTSYSSLPHHTPRFHNTSSIKLATTPPPPQLPTPTNKHRVATKLPANRAVLLIRQEFPAKTRHRTERRGRRFFCGWVQKRKTAANSPRIKNHLSR